MEPPRDINTLPDDLLRACIAALDCPRSFGQFSQVCQRFQQVASSYRRWDTHILHCKLERGIIEPTVVRHADTGQAGRCTAAVAHPSGLMYTAHYHAPPAANIG